MAKQRNASDELETQSNEIPAPMGLTDAADPPTVPTPAIDDAPRGRQPALQIICPYCQTKCVSKGSSAFFTRYYCPNEGCAGNYSTKIARPRMSERIAANHAEDFSAR